MEDILAFEAKKKRSLSFFRRRMPEKPAPPSATAVASSTGPKDKAVDISKKRSWLPASSQERPRTVSVRITLTPGKGHRGQQGPGLGWGSEGNAFLGSRQTHRCPTCSRCFQFKHHLQSHMNSHTNSRPYVCPMCRKTYAHSGSLSTHMKLHHAEGRPRRTLRCEFCEKAFGYVGVYFSHLKEVHKVILTVEPSISQHEEDVPVLR
ncbi:hypothetical protein SKAU_G00065620 [Synaphobranchus kaupii]|uniref:C2H2-type domain-containing protein n=1 Tax=Synaphobranchus kaupii TaxID=118154 RepID=A0A9Q1G5T6_SYNKA|nr:hypothetical protein SKAU_G00065620 [Synaphobranchus kaupii]